MPEPPAVGPDRAVQQFTYLLNSFEQASQSDRPALHGYGEKRKAVLAFVAALAASGAGPTEPSELAEFFLDEEQSWGLKGDHENWSTERTAIELIRHLRMSIAHLNSSQVQESASDRWFTPQPVDAPVEYIPDPPYPPVDAPPREKP